MEKIRYVFETPITIVIGDGFGNQVHNISQIQFDKKTFLEFMDFVHKLSIKNFQEDKDERPK
jgi:hypothetical protein